MNFSEPLISILIPTWNRPQSLVRLIERINLTKHDDIEIIIVDDHSEEENWLKLKNIASLHNNVRLFRNEQNIGLTPNWNKSIEYAKGTWLSFICDDDIYKEDAFSRIRTLIKDITTPCLILQSFEIETATEWFEKGSETARNTTLPPASGQFWHKEITDKLGGFDVRIKYCPDYEFWLRMAYHYPVLKIKDFFVFPNQHDENYMWEIFRKPDLLENVAFSIKIGSKYTLGKDYDNPSILENNINDGLWETLRTIINNGFLHKNKMDIFNKYIIEFIRFSFKMKRKTRMIKVLLRLILYRFYQPLRPSVKKIKLFMVNLRA
ncbi:MAG: glycosyltransferase family 2 protein [Crocinitomicaceae bacterium]|nr:glycosyltransferase family 2 protein [Crocinitomicaceae bacterium]